MGMRFRKSVKFGPFRATVSKSGVSYSFGGKGARVTKRADGRTQATVGVPGSGVYYTTTQKGGNKTTSEPEKKEFLDTWYGKLITVCGIFGTGILIILIMVWAVNLFC